MELWIKTQLKDCLTKVDHIYIHKHNGYYYFKQQDDIILGTYSTEGQAIGILEEIQKIIGWIQKDMKNIIIGELNSLIGKFDDYVYEMPEDVLSV